jgi:hypothetical protein
MSATPADPAGNMENSLFTEAGYSRRGGWAISKEGIKDYPFVVSLL